MKYTPLSPNSIAIEELFQGRYEKMLVIEKCLYQTKNRNSQHFFIEGESGLGKSSLFLKVEQQAKGKQTIGAGIKVNFLVLISRVNE